MRRLALLVACVGTALGLAVPVHADHPPNVDEKFLMLLQSVGIAVYEPGSVIAYAHTVCQWLDAGVKPRQVTYRILGDTPNFMGNEDTAMAYMVHSYMAYCPWHRSGSST